MQNNKLKTRKNKQIKGKKLKNRKKFRNKAQPIKRKTNTMKISKNTFIKNGTILTVR